jgi:hypothetical protein
MPLGLPAGRQEEVFVAGHSLMGVAAVRYALEQAGGLVLLGGAMLPATSGLFPTARTWWAAHGCPSGVARNRSACSEQDAGPSTLGSSCQSVRSCRVCHDRHLYVQQNHNDHRGAGRGQSCRFPRSWTASSTSASRPSRCSPPPSPQPSWDFVMLQPSSQPSCFRVCACTQPRACC